MRLFTPGAIAATLTLAGCFHGPLPTPGLPEVPAPRPEDTDRSKDGLRGPVQRVRTSMGHRFEQLDEYDRAGHVLHRVTRGLETWFRYDARGSLLETVDRLTSLAAPAAGQQVSRRSSRQVDGQGRLLIETTFNRDARAADVLRVTYDEQGRRATETRVSENPPRTALRRFHYDADGRLQEEVEDDGASVTFFRHESPQRVWRARYGRGKSDDPGARPACPWPERIPLTPAEPPPPPPPGAPKPLPGVMEVLRLFGYHPEVPGESLVFVTCELTVTDSRGYTLEQTSPGDKSECHRYNARGDEVVSEKRSGGPGCGWMVTVHTPHETTESKYDYDAHGNWIGRFDVITAAQFPRSSHEISFPLTEILEHKRYRQTFERAITYFPDQP